MPKLNNNFGFARFGEQLMAVAAAAYTHREEIDPRLKASASVTISTEGSGADGGFAVAPDYRDGILRLTRDGFNPIARCKRLVTPSNQFIVPVDRKPAHDRTAGIVAHLESEGAPARQSIPKLETVSGKLKKLTAIVPVSEELMGDAPSLESYILDAGGEAIAYAASYYTMWGGAGEPLGFMNSPALVTVAAEAAQAAGTINAKNIAKMYAHMPATSLSTAVWLQHPDAPTQLIGLQINGQTVYTPGNTEAPAGRMLGCPILPHEICAQVGDIGDIAFVDFQQYLLVTKEPALQTMTSLHFWFDRDVHAFKFRFRFDGLPVWAAPVESRVGGTMRSPFICLGAR